MHRYVLFAISLLLPGCSFLPWDRYYTIIDDYHVKKPSSDLSNEMGCRCPVDIGVVRVSMVPASKSEGDVEYFTSPYTVTVDLVSTEAPETTLVSIALRSQEGVVVPLVVADKAVVESGITVEHVKVPVYGNRYPIGGQFKVLRSIKGVNLPQKAFVLKLGFTNEDKGFYKEYEIPFKYVKKSSTYSKFWAKYMSI